jgi:hypothetical protein
MDNPTSRAFTGGPDTQWAETLKWAFHTCYEEIAQFRFDYPLITVPEAGPKDSLHYYLCKCRKIPLT